MRNTIGDNITLTLFGESHGEAIGCVLDGVRAGVPVDEAFMAKQMDKRRAKGKISTQRHEADKVRVVSGVRGGKATGTPITLLIQNGDTKSENYAATAALARPGHADYTAHIKYRGFEDARGGGHFSGRLTAPVVAAGSIFIALLQAKGVRIATHLARCAGVSDDAFAQQDADLLRAQMDKLNSAEDLAVLNEARGEEMRRKIEAAAAEGDSVGGVLETIITGLPVGLGEPAFGSVESRLSAALFGIPAVKSVAFGAGEALADMQGSRANDALRMEGKRVVTATNHNGGINGGITNGMPLVVRTVIKPTPSIYKPQHTVNLQTRKNATLQIEGRHDPCIAHRARVVQDSMCALVLADLAADAYGLRWQEDTAWSTD